VCLAAAWATWLLAEPPRQAAGEDLPHGRQVRGHAVVFLAAAGRVAEAGDALGEGRPLLRPAGRAAGVRDTLIIPCLSG